MANEGRSPATLVCEACGEKCVNPRALAVHMERHRPVQGPILEASTGREISHPCPAGCGRNFGTLMNFREHAPICDGKPPLDAIDERRLVGTAIGDRGIPTLCPECNEQFEDPEKMAVHIERHRETKEPVRDPKTGDILSRPCPRDCGRNFLSKRDYKEHTEICDGSAPLPVKRVEESLLVMIDEIEIGKARRRRKEGDRMGTYRCGDCGQEFQKPNTLAIHRRFKHGVVGTSRGRGGTKPKTPASPKPKTSAPAAAASTETNGDGIVGQLRNAAGEHRRKAERLDEIIKEVETLL